MAYVYILLSQKDKKRYIGSTVDLERRFSEHCGGHVVSTRNRRPLVLFASQYFPTINEAKYFERKYKNSRGSYNTAIKKGLLKLSGCGSVG